MKTELTSSNESWLREKLKTKDEIFTVAVPASLIILGDHTHYNDGIILSCAIDRYAVASIRKREDDELNINFCDCELSYKSSLKKCSPESVTCGQVSFNELLKIIKEEKIINSGFDCSICSNIPAAIGLVSVAAHQMALLMALNASGNSSLTHEEMIRISREAELKTIGPISNRAHHRTVLDSVKKEIVFNDLRNDFAKSISLGKDYKIVISDTGKIIGEIENICNERISECKVGVEGLRLYIWGIKNLRDVKIDFLKRHVNMIPHRVYRRVYYNVSERIRVEQAIESLSKPDINIFASQISESHVSLREEYEIGSEKLDYLTNTSKQIKGNIASKMISCSPIEGVFSLVEHKHVENFASELKNKYKTKYGNELITYILNIEDGVCVAKS